MRPPSGPGPGQFHTVARSSIIDVARARPSVEPATLSLEVTKHHSHSLIADIEKGFSFQIGLLRIIRSLLPRQSLQLWPSSLARRSGALRAAAVAIFIFTSFDLRIA